MVALMGCGSGTVQTEEAQEDPTIQEIKRLLQVVADSGDTENIGDLRSYIEEDLSGVDEAKSKALMVDYEELESMSGAAAKEKATEMIGKL
jgi:hypothetical protein